jgi:EAL domain-containing protein (putative c-di-GMP-specific phosphodiesterase class I)
MVAYRLDLGRLDLAGGVRCSRVRSSAFCSRGRTEDRLDDFGTGYSSLGYLWQFPFDKIKIDGSFMRAFDGSAPEAETVVKTIIALGRELHMRVTVEGVETAEQAAFLDGANGDQAQGFYFGHPVPASEIAAFILTDFHQTATKVTSLGRTDGTLRVVK